MDTFASFIQYNITTDKLTYLTVDVLYEYFIQQRDYAFSIPGLSSRATDILSSFTNVNFPNSQHIPLS